MPLRMRERAPSRCAQAKVIHKTNIFGAAAKGWALGCLGVESPLGAGREGAGGRSVEGPAGSPAAKSTSPQMSAPGLGPLAPVYLFASFFKISHKSLPLETQGRSISQRVGEGWGGGKEIKSIFSMHLFGACKCLPEPWSLGRHGLDCSHMDACLSPTFLSAPRCSPAKARLLSLPCRQPDLGTPTLSPARHWLSHFLAPFPGG